LDWLSRPLLTVGSIELTVGTLIAAALILFGAYGVSLLVQRMIRSFGRSERVDADPGALETVLRLVHYGIMVVALFWALELVGVRVGTLFTAGAVAAVALGFALQNILQNFVSGLILLTERTITPTDVLEVEGRMVYVVDMRIRSTIARTWDDEELIIPNSVLVQSTVKNFTLRDSFYRIRARVGVAYESDLDRVIEVLKEAASSVPDRDPGHEPVVFLFEFGDSSIVFDVSIWIDDPMTKLGVRSQLHMAIWRGLKNAGITIAFPQLDVHVKQLPASASPGPT
jgi:potassium efflux system protein